MIFPPGSSADPAIWAAEWGGHMAVGLVLCAALGMLARDARTGAALAVLGYGALWEGAVQAFGAGVGDALVDTFAVACGAVIGAAAWHRNGAVIAGAIVAGSIALAAGIRRRL